MKLTTRSLVITFAALTSVALVLRFILSPATSASVTDSDKPLSSPAATVPLSPPSFPPPAVVSAMSSPAELVKKLIADNIVMVFSKSYCPYCRKAKSVLSQFPLKSYHVIELDERNDGDALQDVLGQLTGARSVPRVFIGGKCIGGGDDTERLNRDGKLKAMLEQAGAL